MSNGLDSGYISLTDRQANKAALSGGFKSHLKVFNDHKGFVKGEIHTLIGTKGSGKSTWSKTILTDLVYQDKNVLLFLSEETKDKYLSGLNELFLRFAKTEEKLETMMSKITVISELKSSFQNKDALISNLKEVIEFCKIEIVIFDNFTTSFLSEIPINFQSQVLREFKGLATKYNIPIVMFFHTAKLSDPKRLDGDNVRGSATAVNIGSYNYLVVQYMDGSNLRNFIYTEKSRYHPLANKKMYELTYSAKEGIFTECKDYYFEDYQELISGGKKKKAGFKRDY